MYKRKKIGRMTTSVLLALLILFSATGCNKKSNESDSDASTPVSSEAQASSESAVESAGEKSDAYSMSNFVSIDLNKNKVDQEYFKQYQLTLIFVWAPNSKPCLDMMPDVVKLAKAQKENEIGVLGIVAAGVSTEEEIATAKKIEQSAGMQFPNLLPTDELYQAKLSEIKEVPYVYFVDRNGKQIGEDYAGTRTIDELETIIGFRLKDLK